jgi:T5SS/PEP-CTERM-associated repeat protein/uncharacterized repeat protein (TIGR03803 family)
MGLSFVWTGADGTSFSDANNWDDVTDGLNPATAAPGAADTADITSPANITGPGAVFDLIVGGGTTLTGTITVGDSIEIDSALTLAAGAALSTPVINVSAGGSLEVQTGAVLTAPGTLAGTLDGFFAAASFSGNLTVDGGVFDAGGLVSFGVDPGDAVSVAVNAGGTLDAWGIDLADAAGVQASLSMTGSGTMVNVAGGPVPNSTDTGGTLAVGGGGSVTVTGGATLAAAAALLGATAGSAAAFVSGGGIFAVSGGLGVDGDGSGQSTLDVGGGGLVTVAASLAVAGGLVTIEGGGTLIDTATDGSGGVAVSSGGTLLVEGTAAMLSAGTSDLDVTGGNVTIANGGSVTAFGLAIVGGALLVQNGGTLITAGGDGGAIGTAVSADGVASLDGGGSVWRDGGPLLVGDGGTGTLALTNGAVVSAGAVTIGQGGGTGTITLDGGAMLSGSGALDVGSGGIGTLALTHGGIAGADTVSVGMAGGSGTVSVDGTGSTLDDTGALSVGIGGTGALSITRSGVVMATALTVGSGTGGAGTLLVGTLSTLETSGGATIGATPSANGTVTVSGSNANWQFAGPLAVGAQGAGTLSISSGGDVDASGAAPAGAVTIGASAGATGLVTLSNGTLESGSGAILVGVKGAGTFDVTAEATADAGGGLAVARGTGGTGTVDVDGYISTLSVESYLAIGAGGVVAATNDGSLQVSANATLSAGSTLSVDGTGTIEIGTANDPVAGTVAVDTGYTLTGAGLISGSLALNGVIAAAGGTLEITGTVGGAGRLQVAAGATLKLDGKANGATIVFGPAAGGTLVGTLAHLSGATIDGFAPGDSLVLSDAVGASPRLVVGGGVTTLELFAGTSEIGSLNFQGAPSLTFNPASGAISDGAHTFVWAVAAGVSGLMSSPSSWDDISSGAPLPANSSPVADATIEVGGGAVLAGQATVDQAELTGAVTLSGTGTDLVSEQAVALGAVAAGSVSIGAGSTLAVTATAANGTGNLDIGASAGLSGAVTLEGTGAMLAAGAGRLVVGDAGSGLLLVGQGGAVTASAASYTDGEAAIGIGVSAGAVGRATIDGAGSTLAALGALWVAEAGSGTLVVSNGANVTAGGANDGGTGLWIAEAGGTGSVQTIGGTLTVGDGAQVGAAGTLAASGAGRVSIAGGLSLTAGARVSVDSASAIAAGGAAIVAGAVGIGAGATLAGAGLVSGNLVAAGTVDATGGSLEVSGTVSGTGTLLIASDGTLKLDSPDLGTAIRFATPGGGTLDLASTNLGGAVVQGFAPGDEVVVGNAIGDIATTSQSGTTTTLSLSNGESIGFSGDIDLNFNAATGVITTSVGALNTLFNFSASAGEFPEAGLIIDSAGDLFGTTFLGGASGDGAVFELQASGTGGYAYRTLLSFNGGNGTNPAASLLAVGTTLFGTTSDELGSGNGTVFSLVKSGGTYTPSTLVSFTGANGGSPTAGLLADVSGDLFGTSSSGGANGDGTVFELVRNGTGYTLTTLVNFAGGNGANPSAGLIADAAGNLYGTTTAGGADGDGIVFEIAKTGSGFAGTPVTLYSFSGPDGSGPSAGLVVDTAGDLFGTTSGGGANGLGAVFELTPTGSGGYRETTLASFTGSDGSDPAAGLIIDSVGNLFGTTGTGGVNDDGTAFEIAKNNGVYASTPKTLVSFNGSDGANPFGGLVADASGNLFGTTGNAGANGVGTLFELTNAGYQVPAVTSNACYREGTRIATPAGARAIETLAIGDLVVTLSGEALPIVWLGHRRVDCTRHPKPRDVWPVRVRAGAFGAGMPHADLFLSPDHAVFVEDVLIPVRYLLDGDTIAQQPAGSVVYWHLELSRHDIVLAEGLPAESFLDTGQRAAFANGGAVVALHPDFAQRRWDADACAPLVIGGAMLERVRAKLGRTAARRSA